MAPPPAKKAKTDGDEKENKDAEMKDAAPEAPKEQEKNDPSAAKTEGQVKDPVVFHVPDTTLNVMPSTVGNMLMSFTEGGFHHLLAGARASVGFKSGRYLFEVKVVEHITPPEDGKKHKPVQLLKFGFSTQKSSLFLGDTQDSCCFDTEGGFFHAKVRKAVTQRLDTKRDCVLGLVLNLDSRSPNFNTVSLFKDGARITQPEPLPEALKGKPLFPAVTFKNMTVHANFGAKALAPLPFTCRTVGAPLEKDATVTTCPKQEKYEVVYPVCLPDEGTFDWLDLFLEKNPSYTELSDRMIVDWCEKSGITKGRSAKESNDKPDTNFGFQDLSGASVMRMLHAVAPVQPRNFVVMEVKGNLTKESRKLSLAKFDLPMYKTTAMVLMGTPSSDFAQRTRQLIKQDKQEASDRAFKIKQLEEKNKRLAAKRARDAEKAKKKREKEQKKKLEAAKKKLEEQREAAKKAKEKKEGEENKEEEKKEEEKKEEEKAVESEEEEEEVEEPEPVDEDPPKVELTADEKKIAFRKRATPDLTEYVLSTTFTNFTLPEKEEGFSNIKYEWSKDADAQKYLKKWVLDRKLTTRIENIQPSDWFNKQQQQWRTTLAGWQAKQNEFKASIQKKKMEKAQKAQRKAAAAKAAALKAAQKEAAEKKKAEAKAKAEAEGKKVEEEEKKAEDEEKKEEEVEEEEEEVDEEALAKEFEGLDVFGVDDITNLGENKGPLFKEFKPEDWTMCGLRFELHLLAHAFVKDANDADRPGMHLDHVTFYYNKYYKRALTFKQFGVETCADLINLVQDTVFITKQQVLESQLPESMEVNDIFLKLTEQARRDRELRIDMGEESARLKIQGGTGVVQQEVKQQNKQGQKRPQENQGGNWAKKSAGGGNWQGGGGGNWQGGGGGNWQGGKGGGGGNWQGGGGGNWQGGGKGGVQVPGKGGGGWKQPSWKQNSW